MANNVLYNEPGVGRTFAADEVNSALYQWSKIDLGAPGSTMPLTGTVQFGAVVDVTRIQSGTVTTLGNAVRIKAAPVMSGATYSVGQLIGTKLVLSGATRIVGLGIIESVVLSDKANAKGAVNVVFFEANPVSSTFSDHTTLAVNNTDLVNIVGAVQIATTDYVGFSANAVATKNGLGLEFNSADTNLYAAIISNGTNIYASSSDLQLTVNILMVS